MATMAPFQDAPRTPPPRDLSQGPPRLERSRPARFAVDDDWASRGVARQLFRANDDEDDVQDQGPLGQITLPGNNFPLNQ